MTSISVQSANHLASSPNTCLSAIITNRNVTYEYDIHVII